MHTITVVSDPVWGDAPHTSIICQVTTREAGGPYPFTATMSDPEPHGQQLWKNLLAGNYGAIGEFVAPPASSPKSNIAVPGPHVIG